MNPEDVEDLMYDILYQKLLDLARQELQEVMDDAGDDEPFNDDQLAIFDLGVTIGAMAYERMMFEFASPDESS
jgi:hypothetical protein